VPLRALLDELERVDRRLRLRSREQIADRILFAAVALLFPWILVIPVAIAAAWLGVTLIVSGAKLRRARAGSLRRVEAEAHAMTHPGLAGSESTAKERVQQADTIR